MKALVVLGADVMAHSWSGRTAMHEAANGEAMRWLAARGVSVQGKRGEVNESPLFSACKHGRVDAVRALIELGADLDCWNRWGFAPLHWSVCFLPAQDLGGWGGRQRPR